MPHWEHGPSLFLLSLNLSSHKLLFYPVLSNHTHLDTSIPLYPSPFGTVLKDNPRSIDVHTESASQCTFHSLGITIKVFFFFFLREKNELEPKPKERHYSSNNFNYSEMLFGET